MVAVLTVMALLLTNRIQQYNKEASGQLISQITLRSANVLEKMFVVAQDQLEAKSDEISEELLEELSRQNVGKLIDCDGDGGLYTSFSIENSEVVFPDGLPQENCGIVVDDNGVRLYTVLSHELLLFGNVDVEKINLMIKSYDFFGDKTDHILFDSHSGNIIINSGKKNGFDGTAIGFLKTLEYAPGYSSVKMFSDINKGYSGYAVIKNNIGVNYAVSYEPIGSNGWYILQLAPEQLLVKNLENYVIPVYVLTGILVIATLIYIVWNILASQKASKEKNTFKRDSKILGIMVMQMAENSLATMFVYRRRTDEMDIFRDREVLYPDGKTIKGAISYLEKYFGHSPEEIRRLKNALVLAVSKQYMKLELESESVAGVLISEYTMSAVNGENGAEVVCTVVERPKIIGSEINSFSEDNVYNTTGIEVLLESNSWRFMWNNETCFEKLNFGTDFRSNYDDDLEQIISSYIMSKDRSFFLTALSRLNLLENYRNGNTEFRVKYRINTGGGVYEYRILDVHMYRDGNDDEIKANLYARHIR